MAVFLISRVVSTTVQGTRVAWLHRSRSVRGAAFREMVGINQIDFQSVRDRYGSAATKGPVIAMAARVTYARGDAAAGKPIKVLPNPRKPSVGVDPVAQRGCSVSRREQPC